MDTYQAYETLKLGSDASFEEIKGNYRKLVLELHPDKNKNEMEGNKFKKITEAYHVLKNHHKNNKTNSGSRTQQKYKNTTTKQEQTFTSKKPRWGAPPGGKTPEEDWGRFTKDFEDANPDFWKQYERNFWKEYDSHMKTNSDQREYEKTKEPKKQPDLNVAVDPTLCIGCCSCETIAPEVFFVDKLTKMNPKSSVINPKGAGFNKIMNAAETCPTKAISVENKRSKEKFWPL